VGLAIEIWSWDARTELQNVSVAVKNCFRNDVVIRGNGIVVEVVLLFALFVEDL
jgi:hypothetical protein